MQLNSRHDKLGALAFTAYSRQTKGKSLATGDDLPDWEHLGQPIRDAWAMAAKAVEEQVLAKNPVEETVPDEEMAARPTTATPGHSLVPDAPTRPSVSPERHRPEHGKAAEPVEPPPAEPPKGVSGVTKKDK